MLEWRCGPPATWNSNRCSQDTHGGSPYPLASWTLAQGVAMRSAHMWRRQTGYSSKLTGEHHQPRLCTACSTRSAAFETSSCSQTLMTCQPRSVSSAVTRRSRSTFAFSLSPHHPVLVFGSVPCSGQACQKQESTYTAILGPENTRSGRVRIDGSARTSTRYRSPRRCNSDRSTISGAVSRRPVARMRRATSSELAAGVLLSRRGCSESMIVPARYCLNLTTTDGSARPSSSRPPS